MSRSGSCYDNAAMKRFFWSLKHEWTNHESFENLASARLSVFKYVERFTIPSGSTRRWAIHHPTTSKPTRPRLQRRKHTFRRCPKVLGHRTRCFFQVEKGEAQGLPALYLFWQSGREIIYQATRVSEPNQAWPCDQVVTDIDCQSIVEVSLQQIADYLKSQPTHAARHLAVCQELPIASGVSPDLHEKQTRAVAVEACHIGIGVTQSRVAS